jgi:DivIVA domain-containing protein
MIDPQDIERVEFKITRLKEGYDQDEVDNFLDRVVDSLRAVNESNARLEAENAQLRRKNAELERAANDTPTTQLPVIQAVAAPAPAPVEPTAAAAKLLDLAQKTADDLVAHAQQQAVEITATADQNGRDIVNAATQEADKRRRAAEAAAYKAEQDLSLLADTRKSVRSQLEAQLNDLRNKLGDPA